MKQGYRLPIVGLGMVVLAVLLVLLAPWGQEPVAANGTIHYVDADATSGANNGTSWADAFTTLQPALDAAVSGDQIWVAEGTYTPTVEHGGAGDRYRSFQMKNGVALYGGFDPSVGDTAWEDRDWAGNVTILSGDIGAEGDDSDNSYHVFFHPDGTNLDGTAVLDGFTISGGNANGDHPHRDGGGMVNYGSSPTLANCTFAGNSVTQLGGGMFNASSSSPELTDCSFSENSAGEGGGGMFNYDSSSPVLTNCTFSDNWAAAGGGMRNSSSSPELTNCTFIDNSASVLGGGMVNRDSSPTLANCAFAGNSANYGGGVFNDQSLPMLTNCTFSGNSASTSGGGMYNGSSSPAVTNCILWADTPDEIYNSSDASLPVVTYSDVQGGYDGTGNIDADPLFVDPGNGDYHLQLGSPCIDVGNNDAPGLPDFDFEGDPRILDGDGNVTAIVDMGVDEVAVEWSYFHVYLPMVLRGY